MEDLEAAPKRPLKVGEWSEAALRVLRERYLQKEAGEVVETPEDMCWRVASTVARAEEKWGLNEKEIYELARQFYDLMVDRLFLPNSPTLMNAGKENKLQYSACYVLPVEDSMDGIFGAILRAAIIHKSGGGTGFSFSRLRAKDSLVKSSGGTASGPVSFLRVFNAATEAVKQGGTRRGANMGILRVDHPDILEFIDCKLDGGIANFNISVAATDQYMNALAADGEYDLVEPHTQQVVRRLKAKEVFQKITEAAWRTGDPGMVFIDRINASRANPTPEINKVEATNPCGEQPLYPNEACNLGSVNVARLAVQKEEKREVDWKELERVVRLATRFLDDVIEVNPYPLPEIAESVRANRRVGLGIMGWADLLFELRLPYDSETAVQLAGRLMNHIQEVAHDESCNLSKVRGPFPNWSKSIFKDDRPLRNATVTTIAPTGSISIVAGCSSGIEPVYALAFVHAVGDRRLTFVNPIFDKSVAESRSIAPGIVDHVTASGRLTGIPGVPSEMKKVFVTAHEIAPEWHVKMQAAFQKHTDNGVSKTINLPKSSTADDIAKIYLMAYDNGCLGITVFRDGCKEEQVLNAGTSPKISGINDAASVKPRPHTLKGASYRVQTPLGTAFITVNENGEGSPFEVFLNVGKAGSDTATVAEAVGRLISLILRVPSPLPPRERVRQIVDQLSGIGGERALGFGAGRVRSLPDAVAQVLAEHTGNTKSGATPNRPPQTTFGDLCPDCGLATLVYQENCRKCLSCGFGEC